MGKGTVLIVDDSKTSRYALRQILNNADYNVIAEATNGEDAINLYKQYNPNVVTLDITMPGIDGIETLSRIMDYDPNARVIMVTAAGQKNKMLDAIKLGAAEFVTKPFETALIVDILDKMV